MKVSDIEIREDKLKRKRKMTLEETEITQITEDN